MSLINYPKFKISINPDSKKIQGLQPGDIVRRQYVDGINVIYTLMAVLENGIDEVLNDKGVVAKSPYFIGALLDGDVPNSQQVLDFVRTTNLFNADRSGAIYLTASDSEAPFLKVIDKLGTEKSVCLPYLPDGIANQPSKDRYACVGDSCLITSYSKYSDGAYRAYKLQRNNKAAENKIQAKLTFQDSFKIQEKALVSYKIRANKNLTLPYSFGYTDDSAFDGTDNVTASSKWEYKFHIIQIDSPARNNRSFSINLRSLSTNDWVEISELNIIKLSDVANFANAGKATLGNMNSIVDPVFGTLKGYGVHSENFYATKNVGIAGTLTAGDSNGFSSTFYAGKIYKNMIINSLSCDFNNSATEVTDVKLPARIGTGYKFKENISLHQLTCREVGWANKNKDKQVTFSIWIYSDTETTVGIFQNTHKIDDWDLDTGWRRYNTTFTIFDTAEKLLIGFETNKPLIVCSPQLEEGDTVSQYQPTDGLLKEESDGYGAWFCDGGVGGTIQNPLLKFGADGSIRSRSDSFHILPDGSAYFKGQVEIGNGSTLNGITLIKDGVINTDTLNVRAIFSKEIETETIVGSLLTFKKGTIGGWKITADKLTSETTEGRDHVELSTTGGIKAVVANNESWHLKPDGSGLLAKNNIHWDKSGNVTIIGSITASSGKIGKWNIDADSIFIGTKQSSNAYTTSGITFYSDGTNGAIRSKNFRVDTNGNAYFKGSGEFGGKITASSGSVGGWAINSTSITKNKVSLNESGSIIHTDSYWKLNNDGSGQLAGGAIKWGTNGIWNVDKITANKGSIGAWNIDADSIYSGIKQVTDGFSTSGITFASQGAIRAKQFRIDTDGNAFFAGTLSAAKGEFSGKVTANSGAIGGWNIDTDSIYSGTKQSTNNFSTNGITLASSGAIRSKQFRIDTDGNAFFKGELTATKGYIANWIISDDSIYTGTKWDGTSNITNGITLHTNAIVTNTCIFRKDGSGQLANGKISWTANGTLTIDREIIAANVTADQINALVLNTHQGHIGGWGINDYSIYSGSVSIHSNGNISNGNYWKLNSNGSGQLANGEISWETDGKLKVNGEITAVSGSIAKFTITDNNITSKNVSINQENIFFYNSDNTIKAGIGVNSAPEVLAVPVPVWVENKSNSSINYGLSINVENATGSTGSNMNPNIAITLLNGCIEGLSIQTTRISSTYRIKHRDVYISCYNTSNINLYLPSSPQMGEIKFVRMNSNGWVNVYGNGNTIWRSANEKVPYVQVGEGDGDMAIFIYDGQYWSYNYMPR